MGKLYLFGIGGTGARVIRSFTMLLAAGVDCGATEVIPVLIDTDSENGDVRRTKDILTQYHLIRGFEREDGKGGTKKMRVLDFNTDKDRRNKFFGTQITKPSCGYTLQMDTSAGAKFGNFIELENMNKKETLGTWALVNMLFSKRNLDMVLDIGFKGNPNMGSVVLNQFEERGLPDLLKDFGKDDRIFIISSIFGGTGSSGFPLLLKTLRDNSGVREGGTTFANASYVQNACIGAITVMPYFQVSAVPIGEEKSDVNSDTFISKTIAAMDYYHKSLIRKEGGKKTVDYLYSIADDDHAQTNDRAEGKAAQKNKAHFVEVASALAICDFMSKPNDPGETEKLRFGVTKEGKNGELIFSDLSKATSDILSGPLTQLWLFAKYLTEEEVGEERFRVIPCGVAFKDDFFGGRHSFYGELLTFLEHFGCTKGDETSYIDELAESKSFVPFSRHSPDIFDCIQGITEKHNSFLKPNATKWNLLETNMNAQRNVLRGQPPEARFLEIFWRATNKSAKKRLVWKVAKD